MAADYYVFLGDVVSSRNIPNREDLQLKLQRACAKASRLYQTSIHAKLKLLKGTDEIGAVLTSWQDVFNIINLILDAIHPYQIRFSLVRDCVDVGEKTADVAKMDGTAFHRAATMINQLKQNGLLFEMAIGDAVADLAMTTQVSMLLLFRQHWSVKHHKIVMASREEKTQQFIAREMGISQQEVSRLLRQISWKQYRLMEKMIQQQFELLGGGIEWTAK